MAKLGSVADCREMDREIEEYFVFTGRKLNTVDQVTRVLAEDFIRNADLDGQLFGGLGE